jgi:hypothetical protein
VYDVEHLTVHLFGTEHPQQIVWFVSGHLSERAAPMLATPENPRPIALVPEPALQLRFDGQVLVAILVESS